MQGLTQANEKYCGDLIQKKTYTPDYLSHDKKYNHGEEEFVVLRDHHEPIISREIFERTQRELERRSPPPEQKAKHSNRYCLSGKIVCGCCGCHFVSRSKKRQDGRQYKAWRCYEAAQHGLPKLDKVGNAIGCSVNQQIRDEDFMLMIQMVVKHLRHNKEQLIHDLIEVIRLVLAAGDGTGDGTGKLVRRIEAVSEKKEKLLDLYLSKDITKDEYRRMVERYEKEKADLEEKIKEAKHQKELTENQGEMIRDITATIRALALGEEQDDTFYRNIVEKIVVYSREQIEIYLNLLPYKWAYTLAKLPGNSGKTGRFNGAL